MLNVEGCPSWLKERDWKSRVPLQGYREFESLALRHNLSQNAVIPGVLGLFCTRKSVQNLPFLEGGIKIL